MNEAQNYNQEIARWFSDAVTSSGQQQQEIAKLLGIQKSSITRIKRAEQKLTASQMLILHKELGVPLPQIGGSDKSGNVPEIALPSSRANQEKALFDLAYRKVMEMDNARPKGERLSKFELLELIFYTIESISSSEPK